MHITLLPFFSASHPVDAPLLANLARDLETHGLPTRIAPPQAIPEETRKKLI